MSNTVTKTLTGSRIVFETLRQLGVDTIFGYPGSVVLGIYDELYSNSDIRHVLVRHEQAAVHAAEGYARTSGKCGVVLVTSGPGATNTITGIINAYLDGYPIIILTGQVSTNLIGKNSFQEADICSMVKSCTKKTFSVKNTSELKDILAEAFYVANSGKKGPVLVDLPKDVLQNKAEYSEKLKKFPDYIRIKGDITTVRNQLLATEKPVIVAGGGVTKANAEYEVEKLSKLIDAPIVNTMMGLGSVNKFFENYAGMIGIYGDSVANKVLQESDLIFSVGARFNDRILNCFDKNKIDKKIIQLDIDEEEFNRNINANLKLQGDAKEILSVIISGCPQISHKLWMRRLTELKNNTKSIKPVENNTLNSIEILRFIDKYTKDKDVIFTTEVGQHQIFAAQNLTITKERKLLTSGGSGTMGFGLPAAIGASLACPNKDVICIAGDGSLQMNIQELATCNTYNLPIKIFVFNNSCLGMVRQLQDKDYNSRYSETKISNPNFVKLAESYNIKALRVKHPTEIENAVDLAFTTKNSILIDFVISEDEYV